jgi:hypothetical protein
MNDEFNEPREGSCSLATKGLLGSLAQSGRAKGLTQSLILPSALILSQMAGPAPRALAQGGVPLWTNRYGLAGPWNTTVRGVAVDGSGNVLVAGTAATIKYSSEGVPLWTNAYAAALAVDNSGNVFVTGAEDPNPGPSHYVTIKYLSSGAPIWTNRYIGPGNNADGPSAIAVDSHGSVFVTGGSTGTNGYTDYATVAYSNAGAALWTNRYHSPNPGSEGAVAVAVSASGSVFVTGQSYGGSNGAAAYGTVAYANGGAPMWTNLYSGAGGAIARALAADSSGNVFVTGDLAASLSSGDYATIKYSGSGAPLWTNLYHGPASGADQAHSIAVDGSGNTFVTGQSYSGSDGDDYATVAYSRAGAPLWANRFNAGYGAIANAVAVDSSGDVFVTGFSAGAASGDSSFATVAYSNTGAPLWTNLYYSGPLNADVGIAIAVDREGNIIVAGNSGNTNGYYDYATIKYSSSLPAPVQLAIESDGSGGYLIGFNGIPGSPYRLQRAPSVTGSWDVIDTKVAPASGLVEFHDLNPLSTQAFYRTVQP